MKKFPKILRIIFALHLSSMMIVLGILLIGILLSLAGYFDFESDNFQNFMLICSLYFLPPLLLYGLILGDGDEKSNKKSKKLKK